MLSLTFARPPAVRFAFSPLFEMVLWLRAQPEDEFRRTLHDAFKPASADPLTAIEFQGFERLLRAPRIPDFLTPAPSSARGTSAMEDQLSLLLEVTDGTVAADLDCAGLAVPGAISGSDSDHVLDFVVRGFDVLWTRTFRDRWLALQEILEGDVLVHARRLALGGGLGSVAGGLGPGVAGSDRELLITCADDVEFDAAGVDVILIPSVHAWPKAYLDPGSPQRSAVLYYPARGAGRTRGGEGSRADRMSHLLGTARARVLLRLQEPATTTALTVELGLSLSTVSEHLSRFHRTGLVHRTRVGRRVYYELSPKGTALVELLSGDH